MPQGAKARPGALSYRKGNPMASCSKSLTRRATRVRALLYGAGLTFQTRPRDKVCEFYIVGAQHLVTAKLHHVQRAALASRIATNVRLQTTRPKDAKLVNFAVLTVS